MIAALCLCLSLTVQDPAARPVDAKAIDAAVAELTTAFGKDGTPTKRIEAIGKSVPIVDGRVIDWVAKGLVDKDAAVVSAAVDALGHMKHPSSLDALTGFRKREKKRLDDDETLLPQLFKAIGRHGSPSTIEIFQDGPFDQRTYAAAQARIMALGNIRTREALEALIDMSKLIGVRRADGMRNDFRVALAQLAGKDLGPDSTEWQRWWQEHKKSFEVAKQAPKLDGLLQLQWQRYWGLGEKGEGGEESRGRRGRGGEEKGGEGKGGEGGGDRQGG
jgi:hypothetical protein